MFGGNNDTGGVSAKVDASLAEASTGNASLEPRTGSSLPVIGRINFFLRKAEARA